MDFYAVKSRVIVLSTLLSIFGRSSTKKKKNQVSLAFKGSDKNWNERKQTWNKYYFQIIGNISSSYYLCMVRVEMDIKIESFNC